MFKEESLRGAGLFLEDFIDIDLQLRHLIQLQITNKKEHPFQRFQNILFSIVHTLTSFIAII